MIKNLCALGIISAMMTGCLSTGGLDPNAGPRAINDVACLMALGSAYLNAKTVMPASPTTDDILHVVLGPTASGTAANILNLCAQVLANAGMDVAAIQAQIRSKATREKAPMPKLLAPPKRTSRHAVPMPAVPMPAGRTTVLLLKMRALSDAMWVPGADPHRLLLEQDAVYRELDPLLTQLILETHAAQ